MSSGSASLAVATALALAAGCAGAASAAAQVPAARDQTGSAPQRSTPALYDPAHDLGPLFGAVQLSGIFPDSKTFADARPLLAPAVIAAEYGRAHGTSGFDLQAFVRRRFELPPAPATDFRTDTTQSMEQHIRALWPVLTRGPPPSADTAAISTLIPLPRPYVVPGGRFREVYYWDSFFTMLGLVRSGRLDLVRDMLDNFAWLIARFGHVPNGNRTYYLSRSQPPFFAAMVELYAGATDTAHALPYLGALEAEHAFWMDGAGRLAPGQAYRRVVRLADGSVLNRYWDDRAEPRPEAWRQDFELAQRVPRSRSAALYRNVRATAESGWDFSSRWLRDPADLRTLETTDLVPVDLNSLLYQAERLIAALRRFRGRPGDAEAARRYELAAETRRGALLEAAYDPATGYFYDVRWRTGERVTDRPTLAAAAPLFLGLATPEQGRAVAARLGRDFLRPGGFVTTLVRSGQQWDAPNGWAPLEWMAIEGVRRYGRADLADTARERWLALNRRTYRATGKMMEKYDVVDVSRPAGGGEYPGQQGLGHAVGPAEALFLLSLHHVITTSPSTLHHLLAGLSPWIVPAPSLSCTSTRPPTPSGSTCMPWRPRCGPTRGSSARTRRPGAWSACCTTSITSAGPTPAAAPPQSIRRRARRSSRRRAIPSRCDGRSWPTHPTQGCRATRSSRRRCTPWTSCAASWWPARWCGRAGASPTSRCRR